MTRPGNDSGYATQDGIERPRVIESGKNATRKSSVATINKDLKVREKCGGIRELKTAHKSIPYAIKNKSGKQI